MIFYFDEEIQQLEIKEKWIESVRYLHRLWIKNKDDVRLFRKLSINIWYTLTLDGFQISLSKDEFDTLLKMLSNSLEYFQTVFLDDDVCQWLFGYMIEVGILFIGMLGFNWDEIEKIGKDLIKKSARSGNIIGNILNARNNGTQEDVIKYREKLQKQLKDYFNEESEVDRYFIEILCTEYM